MPEAKPSDSEVWGVMRDGGIRLCDYAEQQWRSGKYDQMSDAETKENIQRWRYIRQRIRKLADTANRVLEVE